MRYHIFDYITTNDNLLKHQRPGKLRNLNTYDIESHSTDKQVWSSIGMIYILIFKK